MALIAPAMWAQSLASAVVTALPGGKMAAQVLIEEVDRRAQILLPVNSKVDPKSPASILIGTRADLAGMQLPPALAGEDSFTIHTIDSTHLVLTGNSPRAVLFAVGKLLQNLDLTPGRITYPKALNLNTAPRYALRGHQLGYRPKTNSYDGWDVAQWDRYIRELALFGTNAIELLPPRTDDDAESPHYPLPPLRMMREMSRIIDSYGLDCWIWFPAMDPDYTDPKAVAASLAEWELIYKTVPRVDAIFVPGGDPGHTPPKVLFPFLEKQAALLHKYHPKAQMWMSPQSFTGEWMEDFYKLIAAQPAWLNGIVFGPQNRVSLAELRSKVPAKMPIRFYPDITHSLRAQYPAPDWDVAYALTLQREPINPRPLDQTTVFRKLQPLAQVGFLTYSEGCNDDVNKFLWSALGWDPDQDPREILRAYSRLLIHAPFADSFTDGLFRLEQNWRGPLAGNEGVSTTLEQFRALERKAPPSVKANWRFQQALYRAYYDAYVRARLLSERAQEQQALVELRQASTAGSLSAMARAEAALERKQWPASDLRARVYELAEALFQSIRMQLSVDKYQAIAVGRGATLDLVDYPLNNAEWLRTRFASIRAASSEAARLAAIDQIVNYTQPVAGTLYDDLGDPANQPHLVRPVGFAEDPAYLTGPSTAFSNRPTNRGGRVSWWTMAETIIETPLEMRYTGLDPAKRYKVRITYAGDSEDKQVKLVANQQTVIHDFLSKPADFRPVEYDIPVSVTRGGTLSLVFSKKAGLGGNGRGVQVAEVWLIPVD